MGRRLRIGNPPIEIALQRSCRARRLSLRVSRLDGRVTLTLPQGVAEREGLDFARAREAWLRGHVAAIETERRPQIGGTLPFEGVELPIVAGPVRGAALRDGALVVPDDPARVASRLAVFLKLAARDRLAAASDRHAAALGRRYGRISLRDTRSRWGSCSSAGHLMYSWRLVMAPPEVLDYVAAHEVAHLVETNHSPDYWTVVDRIFPRHRDCRRWLRDHGAALHRVRFEA